MVIGSLPSGGSRGCGSLRRQLLRQRDEGIQALGLANEASVRAWVAGTPLRMRFTGTSSFFPERVRGTAGTLTMWSGTCRRQIAPQGGLDPGRKPVVRLGHHEQPQLARPPTRVLDMHHQAVGHLVKAFDHGVELGRCPCGTPPRLRVPSDRPATMTVPRSSGWPGRRVPTPRETGEVGLPVAGAVFVTPETHGHGRQRSGQHQLALARLAAGPRHRTPPPPRPGTGRRSPRPTPGAAGWGPRSPCTRRCPR